MRRKIIAIITGGSIGFLTSYLGFDFTTWQFWTFLAINIVSLHAGE